MSLNEWLKKIETLHPKAMDFTLDRIREVAQRLNLLTLGAPIILIGGTNGKGSTITCLEHIYLAHGYDVFTSISPTLRYYNERLRINGEMVNDTLFCEAFTQIEAARKAITLTFFEYSVLAVFYIIKQRIQNPNRTVILLEVGLGGRLDAMNIIDPDLSIITSIDLDHMEYLGHTREAIALEKAGILRSHRPGICADHNPPETLIAYAKQQQVSMYYLTKEFAYIEYETEWDMRYQQTHYRLPKPNILLSNAASSIAAALTLNARLPIDVRLLPDVLRRLTVPGRCEIIQQNPCVMVDVAHNPAATAVLAKRLPKKTGQRFAVFSMLADKDIVGALAPLVPLIDRWFIAPIAHTPRAATIAQLQAAFKHYSIEPHCFSTIAESYDAALQSATPQDQIIIFGSFYVVSDYVTLS